MQTQQEVVAQDDHRDAQHIDVAVVTTSGTFPVEGAEKVSVHQPVKVELEKAQKKLHLTDTTGWIVTVGGVLIDTNKSYADNGLKGSVKLDWGPKEGGGGQRMSPDA